MRTAFLVALAMFGVQAAPPSSEIFLLTIEADGKGLRLGAPVNISNSAGYDNQPSFTPNGRAILFTSARNRVVSVPAEGVAPPAAQMDIFRYDIEAKTVTPVTKTLQSEYSPTVTPDGGMSVIRVEDDGTQRLWRFKLDGSGPVVLLPDVKPVGYHAWIDEHRLALFILGAKGEPATLQIADTRTGRAEVVARDIGRSILTSPLGGISFVQRGAPSGEPARLVVRRFNPLASGEARITTLVDVPSGATQPDLAWMADGSLLLAHEGQLLRWRQGQYGWEAVADLAALGLKGVSADSGQPRWRQIGTRRR